MLLLATLSNCATYESKAWQTMDSMNGSSKKFFFFFFAFVVVIDCVDKKTCIMHILGGTWVRNTLELCEANCVDNNKRDAPPKVYKVL
jgi:hypothetical protein